MNCTGVLNMKRPYFGVNHSSSLSLWVLGCFQGKFTTFTFIMMGGAEKQIVASEMVSSAVYFDMGYVVNPYRSRDLFSQESRVQNGGRRYW